MKKILFVSLFSFFLSHFSFSQQWGGGGGGNWKELAEKMKVGHFYGKIIDSTTNKAIEFASVQLLGNVYDTTTKQMKKNVVVGGQLTSSNGEFSLEKLNVMGKYALKIVALGYNTKIIPISFNFDMSQMKNAGGGGGNSGNPMSGGMAMLNMVDKDLGNIKIKPETEQLKEVTIEASAPVMELKLDKKVFNVEKNIVSSGGTAEDVLKQVPSVSVDVDGNVTMRNAPPQIFVDGKPTTLTLDQIPADAIQSVEIISNPSAKYDASGGQGGILNIVLKKEHRTGYNGNVRASVDKYGRVGGGADINARQGKINVFLSANFNQRHSLTTGTTERENKASDMQPSYIPLLNIHQKQNSVSDGFFAMGRGGFDFFMNNRNTFTLSGSYMEGKFQPTDVLKTTTDTVHTNYIDSSSYNRNSPTNRDFKNAGASLQYKHLFPKEGQEWTADLNYNKSMFTSGGNYTTMYYDANNNHVGNDIFQKMSGTGSNAIYTAQTDLALPWKKDSVKYKIEGGLRGSYRDFASKTINSLKNDSSGEYVVLKNQSVNYKYIDQVYAAYMTYGIQKGKFNSQAGLRVESSFYTGELVDSNKTFKNVYPVSLFPSFNSAYEINSSDNFQFSYTRRINRPNFFQLIPFTDYSDSLNLKRGNAGLKPEFTHSFELSYLKTFNRTNNLLASVYYKYTNNIITSYQVREYDSVLHHQAIINTYENANSANVYGAELTSKHSLKKWLEFTTNFNVYYSVLNADNLQQNLASNMVSWFTKENFTFKLPKNFSVQISGEYRSKSNVPVSRGGDQHFGGGFGGGPVSTAQGYINPRYSVDAAIKYEFMKNKAASISVNIRDIFGTDINETITNSTYFDQTTSRLRDPHFVRVNFAYRFGKFDTSLFKRKNLKVNTEGMEMGM